MGSGLAEAGRLRLLGELQGRARVLIGEHTGHCGLEARKLGLLRQLEGARKTGG